MPRPYGLAYRLSRSAVFILYIIYILYIMYMIMTAGGGDVQIGRKKQGPGRAAHQFSVHESER